MKNAAKIAKNIGHGVLFSKVAYLQSGFTGNSIVLDMKIMEHREAKKKKK